MTYLSRFAFMTCPFFSARSSISANPMPIATPPLICPITVCGLITLPQSCAEVTRTTFTSPVSVSTSISLTTTL